MTGALMWSWECHEEVSRDDVAQPCDRPSVALRLDVEHKAPYPVCAQHVRPPMVPLMEVRMRAEDDVISAGALPLCGRRRLALEVLHRCDRPEGHTSLHLSCDGWSWR